MLYPKKLKPGDKVAILSPSAGLPEIFPEVFNLGVKRLTEHFKLYPVEYPTTRKFSSTEDRARDVNNAFEDTDIKAIICSIGGNDQIKLLKHLNKNIIQNNPKIFMGFSDATHIELYLWNLGIASFYGAAIMTQFAMHGDMHKYTLDYLHYALKGNTEVEVFPSKQYTDESFDWSEPELLKNQRPMFTNNGWEWKNNQKYIEGELYGGCLESLDFQLRVGKYLPPLEKLKDKILFFETSEEIPDSDYVYRVLVGMGERGMLENFAAILVGRAKAWDFKNRMKPEEKESYRINQREAIEKALDEYNPKALAIFNMDFGHTDPQMIIPNGGNITIDGVNKKVFIKF